MNLINFKRKMEVKNMSTYNIELISEKTGEIITETFPINAGRLIELVNNGYILYDMTDLLSVCYYVNVPDNELTIENVNELVKLVDDLDYDPELVLDLYKNPNQYDSIQELIKGLTPYDLEVDYDIESDYDYAARVLDDTCIDSCIYDYLDVSGFGKELLEKEYSHYNLIDGYGLMNCGGWYDVKKPDDITYKIKLTDEIIKTSRKNAYLIINTEFSGYGYKKLYGIVLDEQDAVLITGLDDEQRITYYSFNSLNDIAYLLDDISIDELNSSLDDFLAECENDSFFGSVLSLAKKEVKENEQSH